MTPEDDACARAVFDEHLEAYRSSCDVTAGHALGFAVRLVSKSIDLLERALDTEEDVAREAWGRLRTLRTPAARAVLVRFREGRRAFLERLLGAARAAGYGVGRATIDADDFHVSVELRFDRRPVSNPRFNPFWVRRHEADVVSWWLQVLGRSRDRAR